MWQRVNKCCTNVPSISQIMLQTRAKLLLISFYVNLSNVVADLEALLEKRKNKQCIWKFLYKQYGGL